MVSFIRTLLASILVASLTLAPTQVRFDGFSPVVASSQAHAGIIKKVATLALINLAVRKGSSLAVRHIAKRLADPRTRAEAVEAFNKFILKNPRMQNQARRILDDAENMVASAARTNGRPYSPNKWRDTLSKRFPNDEVYPRTLAKPNAPNAKLAGKGKQIGDDFVPFDGRGWPVFDKFAKFDTRLPNYKPNAERYEHFRDATRNLRDAIRRKEVGIEQFSPEQLAAIEKGADKIPGFTWHHHQDLGRMQLVPKGLHGKVGHMGGYALHAK